MVRALLFLLLVVVACREDRPNAPPPAPKPPVPAPAGLIAEMVVPRPGVWLAELRGATGSSALLVPRTVGGLVASMFGLPLRVVEHVEEEKPLVLAAAKRKKVLELAAAVRVRRTFVEQATRGEDASFLAERDGDLTWLKAGPNARAGRAPAVLAVIDDHLVAGTSREAVAALAPYLARTVAPGAKPDAEATTIDLRPGALAPLLEALEVPELPSAWRVLADPREIVAAARALAAELGKGEVTLDLDEEALVIEARFDASSPEARERLAAWPTMPAKDLLDLPQDTLAVAMWSEDAAARSERARARADALAALAGLDKDELHAMLGALGKGRGADTRIGVRCTGVGLTGFATGSVADAEALEQGLKSAVTLAAHPGVKKRLAAEKLELEAKKTRIERVPLDLWRFRLAPTSEDRDVIDLLGGAGEAVYFAAAGMETIDTLQRLYEKDAEASKALRAAAGKLGERMWLGLLADPQGLHACLQGMPGGTFATPVALGAAPEGKRARLRLRVARPLLRLISAAR